MATVQRTRLSSAVFRLPIERIREGYYSDAYFNFTKELLEDDGHHPRVIMQVIQKKDHSILGGIDEAIAILRGCAGHRDEHGIWQCGWDELEVCALYEGDEIGPREVVLTIKGDYAQFAHLETVYLGCLARRTLVMRNVADVVAAANGKQILFFPARHDHWLGATGAGREGPLRARGRRPRARPHRRLRRLRGRQDRALRVRGRAGRRLRRGLVAAARPERLHRRRRRGRWAAAREGRARGVAQPPPGTRHLEFAAACSPASTTSGWPSRTSTPRSPSMTPSWAWRWSTARP